MLFHKRAGNRNECEDGRMWHMVAYFLKEKYFTLGGYYEILLLIFRALYSGLVHVLRFDVHKRRDDKSQWGILFDELLV